MKRWGLIVAVAAIGMVASSQANATWTVIKWKSGNCQVWDNASPMKPMTADYKAASKPYKTMDKAMAKQTKLAAKKKCM